ncbi:hypothetical protein BDZ97DRAFT_1906421 [Flammula alnicola]|nr:hypothetical protein BDZ97DRAFT_1906421 [Flammula alnicola]
MLHHNKGDVVDRGLDSARPLLPHSLPHEDEEFVNGLLQATDAMCNFAKESVSAADLKRLLPGGWLNDEIINFYGALILARSTTEAAGDLLESRVHYFSSFFWTKLSGEGYAKGKLASWTKKIDIFSKDIVLFAINHANLHWTAVAINLRRKRFESYDSMGASHKAVFQLLCDYLNKEHLDKRKAPFDTTSWEYWSPVDIPRQENSFDCGVFTCHFLEALSRGEEKFLFTQKNMPYLRRRMIWEIGKQQLRGGDYA